MAKVKESDNELIRFLKASKRMTRRNVFGRLSKLVTEGQKERKAKEKQS
jgi:hypothetical protein